MTQMLWLNEDYCRWTSDPYDVKLLLIEYVIPLNPITGYSSDTTAVSMIDLAAIEFHSMPSEPYDGKLLRF